jgi:hypothetical protein
MAAEAGVALGVPFIGPKIGRRAVEGVTGSGSVELQGTTVSALISHQRGRETKGRHWFRRGRGGGQTTLDYCVEGGGRRHQGGSYAG